MDLNLALASLVSFAFVRVDGLDPASLKGGVDAPLATELVTYRDCLDELLRRKGQ